jgi:hypothetical protein
MAEDADRHLLGRFWFAGREDQVLPGWLDLSGRRPVITVAGQFTPPVVMTVVGDTIRGEAEPEFTSGSYVLHGNLSAGLRPQITMLGAQSHGRTMQMFGDLNAFSENGTEKFVGDALVKGAHVSPDGDVLKARFRFSHIDEWTNRSGVVKCDHDFEGQYPVDISYRLPESATAEIPGRGSIRVQHHRGIPQVTAKGVSLEHRAWIEVDARADSLERMLSEFIYPTLNFVSVMLDRPCRLTDLAILTKEKGYFDTVYHPLVDRETSPKPIRAPYYYMGLPHVGIDSLARWIERHPALHPIPAVVAGSLDRARGMHLENELLELASCAEGLDRRMHGKETIFNQDTIDDIKRIACDSVRVGLRGEIGLEAARQLQMKLSFFEPTYKERLNRLIEYTKECMPNAVGVAKIWIASLADARNDLAHLLPDPRNSWETNLILIDSLRWILGAALLRQGGIPEEVIKERLKQYETYQFFVRKAAHYAPGIYKKQDQKEGG